LCFRARSRRPTSLSPAARGLAGSDLAGLALVSAGETTLPIRNLDAAGAIAPGVRRPARGRASEAVLFAARGWDSSARNRNNVADRRGRSAAVRGSTLAGGAIVSGVAAPQASSDYSAACGISAPGRMRWKRPSAWGSSLARTSAPCGVSSRALTRPWR